MDAWLTRRFDRHGGRYPAAVITVIVTVAFLVLTFAVGVAALYAGLSLAQTALACAALVVALAAGGGIGTWSERRALQPLFAWCRGERSPAMLESAGEWAFQAPRRLILRIFVVGTLVGAPIVIPLLATPNSLSIGDSLGIMIIAAGAITSLGAASYALLELAARPLRASVGLHELPDTPRLGLATTLLIPPLLAMFAGIAGGAMVLLDRDGALQHGLLFACAVAATMTVVAGLLVVPLYLSTVLAPIRALIDRNRAVAAGRLEPLAVASTDEMGELAASFNAMVAGLADRERLRIRNAGLVEELRASRTRIVAASDEARRQVERDLHDGAQQGLVLLNLKLSLLERELTAGPEPARELAGEIRDGLNETLDRLRDLAHGIYPTILTNDGLVAALTDASVGAALPTEVAATSIGRYASELEAAVYFCVLEAVQNACKHAGDRARVSISLSDVDGEVRFAVADDGVGFETHAGGESAGLQNMVDRIGALGGHLRVSSAPGEGTVVAGAVPRLPRVGTRTLSAPNN